MATRNEAAQKLADIILEIVLKNGIDLKEYSRVVDTVTGTPIVTSDQVESFNSKILYGQDYRQGGFDEEFIQKIDSVVDDCLCSQHGVAGCIDYTIPDMENLGYNPGQGDPNDSNTTPHDTYGYDAWIAFGPSVNVEANEQGGSLCMYTIEPSPLRLTENILEFLSQFLPFVTSKQGINPDLAEEVLDTNIYELIPGGLTRQQRIDRLFAEFNDLIGPSPLETSEGYDLDVDEDGIIDTWIDLITGQESWNYQYGIKPSSNPNVGNIVRLERHAEKSGQSLESMRSLIDDYLRDLDYGIEGQFDDDRDERSTSGAGYLQIRHLNQSIIVRNEQDKDIGIVGDNEFDPNWARRGFTISMWVRFLTKTSGGTLFNFGNPTRSENPQGFKLETFTISKDDYEEDGEFNSVDLPTGAFLNSDYARFVRLVVHDGELRDSHFGTKELPRLDTTMNQDYGLAYEYNNKMAFNYVEIPINYTEWYYIVATYNPYVDEEGSFDFEVPYIGNENQFDTTGEMIPLNNEKMWWENHIHARFFEDTGQHIPGSGVDIVAKSGYGSKCKVEFISKSDMDRALGYKQ